MHLKRLAEHPRSRMNVDLGVVHRAATVDGCDVAAQVRGLADGVSIFDDLSRGVRLSHSVVRLYDC